MFYVNISICGFCFGSFVGTFIPRKDRIKDMGQNTRFTNLYIKNFGEDMTDESLNELFSAHGKIMSAVVMKDKSTGKSVGYGFVSFDDHASAAAVSVLCIVNMWAQCCVVGYGSYEWPGHQWWTQTLCITSTEEERAPTGADAQA